MKNETICQRQQMRKITGIIMHSGEREAVGLCGTTSIDLYSEDDLSLWLYVKSDIGPDRCIALKAVETVFFDKPKTLDTADRI